MNINIHTNVKVSLKLKGAYGMKQFLYRDVRTRTVGYFLVDHRRPATSSMLYRSPL